MIRKLNRSELEQSLPLIWRVFCEYEAKHYPDAGKKSFYDAIHSEEYLNLLSAYGDFENDELVGIIATRNEGKHIALFFVDGNYQQRGIGRRLWNCILKECTGDEITVHSSVYARDIYIKLGFIQAGNLCEESGIQYIPMVYKNSNS